MSGSELNSKPEILFKEIKIEKNPPLELDLGLLREEKEDWEPEEEKEKPEKEEEECRTFEMHSNFNLGKNVAYAIEYTPGVEGLKVVSPYRAIIGIGLLFDIESTKSKIKKSVSASLRGEDLMSIIDGFRRKQSE